MAQMGDAQKILPATTDWVSPADRVSLEDKQRHTASTGLMRPIPKSTGYASSANLQWDTAISYASTEATNSSVARNGKHKSNEEDVLPIEEADVIVEKAFALPEHAAQAPMLKKLKPLLIRTKLARPELGVTSSAATATDAGSSLYTTPINTEGHSRLATPSCTVRLDGPDKNTRTLTADAKGLERRANVVPESPDVERRTPTIRAPPDRRFNAVVAAPITHNDSARKPAVLYQSDPGPPVGRATRAESKEADLEASTTGGVPLPVVKQSAQPLRRIVVQCEMCKTKKILVDRSTGKGLCSHCKQKQEETPSFVSILPGSNTKHQPALSSADPITDSPIPDLVSDTADHQLKDPVTQLRTSEDAMPIQSSRIASPSHTISVGPADIRDLQLPLASVKVVARNNFAQQQREIPAAESFSSLNVTTSTPPVPSQEQQQLPPATPPLTEDQGMPDNASVEHMSQSPPASLSPPPADKSRATVRDLRSRKSAGESYTWDQMICFALREAPGYRLQARGMESWLKQNFVQCLGFDMALRRIQMTLSAHDSKGKRLWSRVKFQDQDTGQLGRGDWYVLDKRMIASQPRWDPVLKRAVFPHGLAEDENELEVVNGKSEDESDEHSPPIKPSRAGRQAVLDRAKIQPQLSQARKSAPGNATPNVTLNKPETASGPAHVAAVKVARNIAKQAMNDGHPRMQQSRQAEKRLGLAQPMDESSDQEALSTLLKSKPVKNTAVTAAPLAGLQADPSKGPVEEDEEMLEAEEPRQYVAAAKEAEFSNPLSLASAAMTRRPQLGASKPASLDIASSNTRSLAERIRLAADKQTYTIKRLLDAWPEYAPVNIAKREEQAEAARTRPTRKQIFGRSTIYSRIHPTFNPMAVPTRHLQADTAASAASSFEQRSNRSPQKHTAYSGLPALEPTVRICSSIGEFFAAPANPLPVVDERGKVGFRDGTLGRDGKLPRRLVVYPAGYE
ncbi:hypothetical protein LTR62_007344 [Meristemomyces frigidus]|uniref:Uncharacterized protein n=1 Tax=Meristemomyces frigidus TaxID=1508187 RepID=A0AAN7YJ49_9PEZI|nr:hypothetical protein LTR62_007344 [Meristemomyces frigidus]